LETAQCARVEVAVMEKTERHRASAELNASFANLARIALLSYSGLSSCLPPQRPSAAIQSPLVVRLLKRWPRVPSQK